MWLVHCAAGSRRRNRANNDFDTKMLRKIYRRRRRLIGLDIPDEILVEILVRLPVKAILRFKSVCKAWHAIISHPSFTPLHLQQSASRHGQQPSFLVAPHTMESIDGLEPCNLHAYQWQEGQRGVTPLYARDFGTDLVCRMSHCDGLVMVPTSSGVYVINPATGDFLMLPDCQEDQNSIVATVGFGLDPCSNKYKVAHYFYRSVDASKGTYDAGMEVFTIGGSRWREAVEVPPYPLHSFRAVVYSKARGSLFWHISEDLLKKQPPQGILRFGLDDEAFSFVPKPYLEPDVQPFRLLELGEQLCLVQYLSTKLVIWALTDDVNDMWYRRYAMDISILWGISEYQLLALPLAMLNNDGILVKYGNNLVRFNLGSEGEYTKELAVLDQIWYPDPKGGSMSKHGSEFYYLDVVPYMESLVPLRSDQDQEHNIDLCLFEGL